MKPLIIFFMAIAAINGFFLSDQARQEFYQEMERIFSSRHKYIMNGDIRIPLEPIKMSELMRAVETFQALSEQERGALKNYLFGVKFPRPVPAAHIENHPFDEEKLKEIHDKWESMTPEEREEIRNNRRKDFDHTKPDFIHRFPRDMPEHEHSKDCDHFDEQKKAELREKFEAMTPEEREELKRNFRKDHGEIKSRSSRSIHTIRPPPEFINYPNDIPNSRPFPRPEKPIARPEDDIGRPADWNSRPFPRPERPIARPEDDIGRPVDWHSRPFPRPEKPIARPENTVRMTRPVQWISQPAPLPEVDRILYPIDGNFQPIKPIQELESPSIQAASDNGRTRPVDPVSRDRMPQPIRPLPIRKSSSDYSSLFDDMTDEERLQVIRELFPEGLPIRPIGPIPIIPAEKDGALVFEHDVNDDDDEDIISRNVEDYPHRSRRPRNFQPILPLQRQPILPIKSQPILPHQTQPILPFKSQPILPQQFQPIMPLQFQPIMPLQKQPILPIKSQPILPNQFQPIMPF